MSISLAGVKILGSALIFIFGCLGACAPVAAHHGSKRSVRLSHYLGFVQQLMLSLGAGVVLATAFVHILPEGVESLANGGLGGDEHDHHDHDHDHDHDDHTHSPNDNSTDHDHDHDHDHLSLYNSRRVRYTADPSSSSVTAKSIAKSKLRKLMRGFGAKTRKDVAASSSTTTVVTTDLLDDSTLASILASVRSEDKLDAKGLRRLIMAANDDKLKLKDSESEDVPYLTHNAEDEPYPWAYLFVLIGIALTFVVESELHRLAGKTKGATMKVHLVEAGIAMHSILVGIAFGALSDISTGKTLMIALFFHQMCEGFAIGPLIHKGSNSLLHAVVLIVIFGGATPVGIAIGAIVDAYSDPKSKEAQLTQGIMMLIACGLLVHVGCVEFLAGLMHDIEHQAQEIEHEHEVKVHRRKERQIVEAAAKALHIEGTIDNTEETEGGAGGLATRTSFVETWGGPTTRGSNGINNGTSASERSGLIDKAEKNVGDEEAEEAEEARQIEEMKNDFLSQNPKITRIATYVFFYIGAALMSLIALWV